MTQDDSRMSQNEGERQGGLFLGRFYFSKWLTFPVLGHKKVLVYMMLKYISADRPLSYINNDDKIKCVTKMKGV